MKHPTNKQERRNFVRTKLRQRQPDLVRKAGPHLNTTSRRAELLAALEEWELEASEGDMNE